MSSTSPERWRVGSLDWASVDPQQAAALRADYFDGFQARLERFRHSLPEPLRGHADGSIASLDVVWSWWVDTHQLPSSPEDEEAFFAANPPLWARATHGIGRQLGASNCRDVSDLAAYVSHVVLAAWPDATWTHGRDDTYANFQQPLLQATASERSAFFPDNVLGVTCLKALQQPDPGPPARHPGRLRELLQLRLGEVPGSSGEAAPVAGIATEPTARFAICRPSPSLPKRSHLVVFDEELIGAGHDLLNVVAAALRQSATVVSVDINDDSSLVVELRRRANDSDLFRIVDGALAAVLSRDRR
jgi:hypothetical protein